MKAPDKTADSGEDYYLNPPLQTRERTLRETFPNPLYLLNPLAAWKAVRFRDWLIDPESNRIGVTKDAVLALFDNELWILNTSLEIQSKQPDLSSIFNSFQAHPDGDTCMIEMNPNANVGVFSSFTYHFTLFRGFVGKDFRQQINSYIRSQILLDDVRGFNQ